MLPAALLLASAHAQDLEVGGTVRPELAVDLAVPDPEIEHFAELHTWLRMWARGSFERGDRWFIEGRFQHHTLASLVQAEGIERDPDVEAWWEVGLGETGWDGKLAGPVDLRIGTLVERWGKLEALPVADVLNPRDLRSGPMVPQEFLRIPIPMAKVSVGTKGFESETTIIPFVTADRFNLRETDWSFIRRGMADDALAEISSWPAEGESTSEEAIRGLIAELRTAFNEMTPQMRRNLDLVINLKDVPEAFVVNGEIAQRFELSGRAGDIAIMGGALHSRTPLAILDPYLQQLFKDEVLPNDENLSTFQAAIAGGPLNTSWPRQYVAGADGSTIIGPFTARGDVMWKSETVVRRTYGNAETTPTLAAGVGLDYLRGTSFLLTAETRYTRLLDVEDPDDLLFFDENQVQVALGFRVGLMSERLWLQGLGAYDISFSELLLRPNVSFRVSDHVQLDAGAILVEGSTPAPEDIFQSLVYEGSLGSYFDGNDCVTLAVTLIK